MKNLDKIVSYDEFISINENYNKISQFIYKFGVTYNLDTYQNISKKGDPDTKIEIFNFISNYWKKINSSVIYFVEGGTYNDDIQDIYGDFAENFNGSTILNKPNFTIYYNKKGNIFQVDIKNGTVFFFTNDSKI